MPAPHYSDILQAGWPSCHTTNSIIALKLEIPSYNHMQTCSMHRKILWSLGSCFVRYACPQTNTQADTDPPQTDKHTTVLQYLSSGVKTPEMQVTKASAIFNSHLIHSLGYFMPEYVDNLVQFFKCKVLQQAHQHIINVHKRSQELHSKITMQRICTQIMQLKDKHWANIKCM